MSYETAQSITIPKLYSVETKSNSIQQLFDTVDFNGWNLSALQQNIESKCKEFQESKVKDSINKSAEQGKSSDSVIGASLKKYYALLGAFFVEQIPFYLINTNKLSSAARCYLQNMCVSEKVKPQSAEAFANRVAQIVLDTVFNAAFDNAKLEEQIGETLAQKFDFTGVTAKDIDCVVGQEIEKHARLVSYRAQDAKATSKLFQQFLKDPVFGGDFAMKSVIKTAEELGLTWEPWTNEDILAIGDRLVSSVAPKVGNTELDAEKWSCLDLFNYETVQLSKTDREVILHPTELLLNNAELAVASAIGSAYAKLPLFIRPFPHTEDVVGGYHTDVAMGGQKKVRHLNSKDEAHVVLGEKALNALNSVQNIPYEVNSFVLSWIDSIKWEMVERTNDAMKEDGKYRTPSIGKFVPYVKGLSKRASRKTYRTETTVAAAYQYSGNVFYHAWLPDYRGRMYPLSSILSPQGTDFEKSLIKFANSGPVNDRAVYWLKIQVANTFGLDKKSFAERVEWVDNNHELISSVATDPIESFDCWSNADSPWTFLAACEEFHACVITKSRTVTNLPVAVDATCSGIQVLSGLTRDSASAHLVNVSPSDAPQDAYTEVMKRAIVLLQSKEPLPSESGNGLPMERVSFDSWVHLDRSVAKKVVMTVPYNATADSNASHVSKALRDKDVVLTFQEINEIVRALRLAVQETLPNAIAFRDWLNGVACLKAKSLDGDVFSWTTPSGVTLVQPIRKWKTVKLDTMVFGRRSQQVIAVEPTDKLNSAKIRTATSPNLIHSLDASILHIACDSLGDEQFTLIHDSVLALASDMDNVQTALRNAYVTVFGGDIYAQMVEFFTPDASKLTAADKKKLSSPPAIGDLDPSVVFESDYFFS